jgi:GNAT superfamily N-acetyltransferase
MTVKIRKVEADDASRWRELWDGYTRFYEREPVDEVTHHAWTRILDPASPVHAIVAEREDGFVIGMANYLVHESTSQLRPVCYLQDLFVDPEIRGEGVGARLIDWLVDEAKRNRWSRLYWNTRENNYRARALYDRYTPHSGFVRYVIDLPAS